MGCSLQSPGGGRQGHRSCLPPQPPKESSCVPICVAAGSALSQGLGAQSRFVTPPLSQSWGCVIRDMMYHEVVSWGTAPPTAGQADNSASHNTRHRSDSCRDRLRLVTRIYGAPSQTRLDFKGSVLPGETGSMHSTPLTVTADHPDLCRQYPHGLRLQAPL